MSPLNFVLLLVVLSALCGMLLMGMIREGLEPSFRTAAFIVCAVLVEVLVFKLYTLLPTNP